MSEQWKGDDELKAIKEEFDSEPNKDTGYLVAQVKGLIRYSKSLELIIDDFKQLNFMSPRDQFASSALNGMLATSVGFQGGPWDKLAKDAYDASDAMLKARKHTRVVEL